jgi:hypothetical protein
MFGLAEYRLAMVPSAYQIKRAYLEKAIDNVKVIVTGSSQAYFGIRPQMLGAPAYSVAYVSQDLYYDTRIVLDYLPQAENLKLVVVTISYFSFESMLEDSTEAWRTSYYYRFWDIPHAMPKFLVEDYSYVALYGIPQDRKYFWQGIPETIPYPINENGGNADQRVTDVASVLDGFTTIERHTSGLKPKYVERNERYLDELFSELKKRNIRAILVTTPCFHSYYDNMDLEVYLVMQDKIAFLAQKYHLEYYNYMTDSRFTLYDFADSDHLSTTGAEKFSQMLKDEVLMKYVK